VRPLRAVLAVVLGVAVANAIGLPAVAGAQTSNPLSPGLPQPSVSVPTTTPPPTISTSTTAGGGSGLSGNSAIIIAIGALVVLGGISFYIWRDARRRAPARHKSLAAELGESRRAGSKPRAKPRKLSPQERRRRKRGRAR
jgi:hypothetical protein